MTSIDLRPRRSVGLEHAWVTLRGRVVHGIHEIKGLSAIALEAAAERSRPKPKRGRHAVSTLVHPATYRIR